MITFLHIRTYESDRSVIVQTNHSGTSRVVDCSPSLKFMKGWTKTEVYQYCAIEGWKVDET